MKRHAGSPGSTTKEAERTAARKKAREKRIRRENNILTKNTSLAERARRRGETTVEASKPKSDSFLDSIRRGFGGTHDYRQS